MWVLATPVPSPSFLYFERLLLRVSQKQFTIPPALQRYLAWLAPVLILNLVRWVPGTTYEIPIVNMIVSCATYTTGIHPASISPDKRAAQLCNRPGESNF